MGVVANGLRDLTRVDRAAIGPIAGALRVVPVVALFGVGLAWWGAQDAITLALGAHLVGVASTVKSGRSATAALALNAIGLGVATYIGSVTESAAWLHVVVLALFCLGGGLLVAAGPLLGILGTQAVIAFLVFGRFPEDASSALRLGALVIAGALIETVFLGLFRWPTSFRLQREAIATAFAALAASTQAGGSTMAAGSEFDWASTLLFPGFLGRDDERSLRGIVDEGRRMRIDIAAFNGLRRRLDALRPDPELLDDLDRSFHHAGAACTAIAASVKDARHCTMIAAEVTRLEASLRRLAERQPSELEDPLVSGCFGHLRALAGQLRASIRLLDESRLGHRHLSVHPTGRLRAGRNAVVQWGLTMRANLTLTSPAMRHAVRLAFAVPAADLIARAAGLPRSYWVPLTVAVVLRPDFGSLFTRGIGRVLGTSAGVTAAGFLVAGLHPDRAWTVVAVGLAAWGAYATYQANFAVGSTFVAAIVLLLLSVGQIDTTTTALDRLLDTLLGGAFALGAYLVWPTWSNGHAREALGRLSAAQAAYLQAVLAGVGQRAVRSGSLLSEKARAARLAWTEAQATVARSIAEPTRWRIDADLAQSLMGGFLRIIQAAHALRAEIAEFDAEDADRGPLALLAEAIDTAMAEISGALRENRPPAELPPLRALYDAVALAIADRSVLSALDEIVDAINTVAHLLGDGVLDRTVGAEVR
jgi:uncharacterized membrane protein YgaE (UPF0421/DUF939 family)